MSGAKSAYRYRRTSVLGSGSETSLPVELPGGVLGGYDFFLSCNICLAMTKLLKGARHGKPHFYVENKKHPLFYVQHLTFPNSPWLRTKAVGGRIT